MPPTPGYPAPSFSHGFEQLEPRQFLSAAPAAPVTLPQTTANTPAPVIVNGGFEDPTPFNGWATDGNATIQTSGNYITAPQGQQQAVLSTGSVPVLGSPPDTAANIESFLSLPSGVLSKGASGTAIDGSAIKQTFTAHSFDVVSFKADFLTNETGNNDYGFVTLTSNNGFTQFFKIRGPLHPTSDLIAANTSLNSESGYHTYYLLVPTGGKWTLGFGVVNTNNAEVTSNLAVDDVAVTPLFGSFFIGNPFASSCPSGLTTASSLPAWSL